ncbi:hypothetical protein llg_29300 [Luteolibacter sp. LG18]|nr:hypothetical protein llg_29300 [Luteolibacter sp. LG18]
MTSLQVEAMPMMGFWKSCFSNPTAYSIARLGARSGPSSIKLENVRVESDIGGMLPRGGRGVKTEGFRI